MKVFQSYNTGANTESKEKEGLSAIILAQAPVRAIFLLGTSCSFTKTNAVFSTSTQAAPRTVHYYLLLLIEKDEEHTLNAVQDKMESNLQHFIPTTAIVLSASAFIAWLTKGHRFATDVLMKAERLYQSENIAFPVPPCMNEEEQKHACQQLFKQSKRIIEGFLASVELHRLRQEYKLAAFMLHQALEQTLRAMLIINTGLKINTHSIDKLLRYCSMFCPELVNIFSKANEKENKLYSLINKAYIDTRYKDDYAINYEELACLTEKTKMVQQLFENCKPKALCF